MFIGQCAYFVIGDDDAPTARMHIWKFLQWFFLPFLCFRISYKIRYLYGQFDTEKAKFGTDERKKEKSFSFLFAESKFSLSLQKN